MDSVGEGKGGMIWENGIETCIISYVKQITSPGLMHDTGCSAAVTGTLSVADRSYPTSEVRGSGRECQAAMVQDGGEELPKFEVRGGGQEELPRFRGQRLQPGGATSCPRSGAVAERSYSASEFRSGVRDEGQQLGKATPRPHSQGQGQWLGGATPRPHAQGQGRWPGGATPRPRSHGCAGAGGPRGAIPH